MLKNQFMTCNKLINIQLNPKPADPAASVDPLSRQTIHSQHSSPPQPTPSTIHRHKSPTAPSKSIPQPTINPPPFKRFNVRNGSTRIKFFSQ